MIIAVCLLVTALSIKAQNVTLGMSPVTNIDSTTAVANPWYSDLSGSVDSADIIVYTDTSNSGFGGASMVTSLKVYGASASPQVILANLPIGRECNIIADFLFYDNGSISDFVTMDIEDAVTFTTLGQNQVPYLVSISPSIVIVGANTQTLYVIGQNFIPQSSIWFNGTVRTTTFISDDSLSCVLTQGDQAFFGAYPVYVTNPTPGGGQSSSVNFTVLDDNPAPIVNGVSPSSVQTGSGQTTFLVDVADLLQTTTLTVNGVTHAYTLLNPSTVSLTLDASYFTAQGTVTLVFTNQSPGGGSVTATISVVDPNPIPVLNSFTPDTVSLGSGDQLFHALVSNLVNGALVRVGAGGNITEITPDWINPNTGEVDGLLPAHLFDSVTILPVRIWTPGPGGGTSNALYIVVVEEEVVQNPTPQITVITPSSVEAGSGDFLMTLNFSSSNPLVQGGTIRFGTVNFLELVPEYINQSGTLAQVIVPGSLIEVEGGIAVKSWNPGPSGGQSNTVFLTVTEEQTPQDTNILTTTVVSNVGYTSVRVAGQLHAVENLQLFSRITENIVSGPFYEANPTDYTPGDYSLSYDWNGLTPGTTYYVQYVAVNIQGVFLESNWKTFQTFEPTGIHEVFNESMQFDRIELYDLLGRPIQTVESKEELLSVPEGAYTYAIYKDGQLIGKGSWGKKG